MSCERNQKIKTKDLLGMTLVELLIVIVVLYSILHGIVSLRGCDSCNSTNGSLDSIPKDTSSYIRKKIETGVSRVQELDKRIEGLDNQIENVEDMKEEAQDRDSEGAVKRASSLLIKLAELKNKMKVQKKVLQDSIDTIIIQLNVNLDVGDDDTTIVDQLKIVDKVLVESEQETTVK